MSEPWTKPCDFCLNRPEEWIDVEVPRRRAAIRLCGNCLLKFVRLMAAEANPIGLFKAKYGDHWGEDREDRG